MSKIEPSSLARRGAFYRIREVDFGDVIKRKYCVLMEDYDPGKDTLVVVFTTHSLDFEAEEFTVFIPEGTFSEPKGDGLIDCNNFLAFPTSSLLNPDDCTYLGKLPVQLQIEVNEAVYAAFEVPNHIWIRMSSPSNQT